ncbi:MAG: 30S ribosomal protein S1 [candidate division BRC1 bacterium ADurb.BinA292]|nr:MAG: 30S ribosomal protein S1 [candidate division BRC1 bacterium ADurb.BinA292]
MAEHTREADEKIPSNWNQKPHPAAPDDEEMPASMGGSALFAEEEDDYLDPDEVPAAASEEMDAMIDQYLDQMTGALSQGQLLTVPVVAIKSDHVLVDIGEKSEGIIHIREFPLRGNVPDVQLGQEIEVVVKGYDAESGLVNLSYQEARRRKALEEVNAALEQGRPIKGTVTRTVKGGLILDIGTTAFLPASQIDLRRVENFEEWIGRELEALVIEHVPEKRRIIVSRRRLLEREREQMRQQAMSRLEVGSEVDVVVKRIVDFGVFVDLGGVDGLIPRSEVSWQRNARPEDYFNVGDTIRVKVIEIDQETGKITLSRRLAMADPWETAVAKYPAGSEIRGTVVSLTNYGAFVRLEEGLDGMIHISDMAWDAAGHKPGDYVQAGQEVSAQVLNVDREGRRISLGLKQMTRDPWEDVVERFPRGTHIKGPVTGLTKYGAFVELEPGIEGMIHVSDFSWDKRVSQPKDVVHRGEEIEAVVLDIDRERRRISLGVKQLSESPLALFKARHKVGDIVEGEVTGITEFGAFVRLADGVDGFLHVSQIDRDRVEKVADHIKVGDTIRTKIVKIDSGTGKISLSRRQMMKEQEKKVIQSYLKRSGREESINPMGELLEDINLLDDLPSEPESPQPREEAPEVPIERAQRVDRAPEEDQNQLADGLPEAPGSAGAPPAAGPEEAPRPTPEDNAQG